MDMTPLILSLKAAAVATVLVILTGIPVSYLAARMKRGKSIVDVICTLPMVLPPTVVGFFLLLLFGKNSMLGAWLMAHGIPVVFSQTGMVIASAVVSFPLLYRTARGAFEQVNPDVLSAGRTLGMSEWNIFWKVQMPIAWPGVISGAVLAFARGLGEFGATAMIAGNIRGKTRTLPLAVYSAVASGKMDDAGQYVVILVGISFIVVVCMNYFSMERKG